MDSGPRVSTEGIELPIGLSKGPAVSYLQQRLQARMAERREDVGRQAVYDAQHTPYVFKTRETLMVASDIRRESKHMAGLYNPRDAF